MTNKYANKFSEEDGYFFRSRAEHRRYCELKLLLAGAVIASLELQPRYPVVINGAKICTYVADFRYRDNERDGVEVVEDVKGARTQLYCLKKKLVEALYGIVITEVES